MATYRPRPAFVLTEPIPIAEFLSKMDFQLDGVWWGFRVVDGKVMGVKLDG